MAPRFLIPVLLLLAACQSFDKQSPPSEVQPEPDKVLGFDIPPSAPLRDPFTTYFKVTREGNVVGYVVRYDEKPAGSDVERPYAAGTLFVEDAQFTRLGFVSAHGRGYRFRAKGQDAEVLGEGTIEELLPGFFGSEGLVLVPLR
jgi:hypothetical protein